MKTNESVVSTHVIDVVRKVRTSGNDLDTLNRLVKEIPDVSWSERVLIRDAALDQLMQEATARAGLAIRERELRIGRRRTSDMNMVIAQTTSGQRIMVGESRRSRPSAPRKVTREDRLREELSGSIPVPE